MVEGIQYWGEIMLENCLGWIWMEEQDTAYPLKQKMCVTGNNRWRCGFTTSTKTPKWCWNTRSKY